MSMPGNTSDFAALVNKEATHVFVTHRILFGIRQRHCQQSLTRSYLLSWNVVHSIRARALNHWVFQVVLSRKDMSRAEYEVLLCCPEVLWLSSLEVLEWTSCRSVTQREKEISLTEEFYRYEFVHGLMYLKDIWMLLKKPKMWMLLASTL